MPRSRSQIHGDAVRDCDEEHALRENPRRHEVKVAEPCGRDGADLGEDLAEDQEPERRRDGLLLVPGMTANVRFVTAQKPDVLKIPNAALRFRPLGAGTSAAESTSGSTAQQASPPSREAAGRCWLG
jgi:hypothetical protein